MAYTDMTTTFSYNRRIMTADYTALADNAAFNYAELNRYELFVYGAAQSISGSSQTKLTFNTVEVDANGVWDSVNNRWNFARTGYYEVICGVVLDPSTIALTNQYRLGILGNSDAFGGLLAGHGNAIMVSRANGIEVGLVATGVINCTSTATLYAAFFLSTENISTLGGIEKKWLMARRVHNL